MNRLFIAVELPEDIKKSINDFQKEMESKNIPFKWTKPDNIHITLKFLGETEDAEVVKIKNYFQGVSFADSSIDISIKGTGVFPMLEKPRIFWIGIENGQKELTAVADKLNTDMNLFGFEKESREFKPHITIGRTRGYKSAKPIDDSLIGPEAFQEMSFTASKIVLVNSNLKPTGAEYKILAENKFV